MKFLRVGVTEDEYVELQKHITHFGEISFILRKAVKEFIESHQIKPEVNNNVKKSSRSRTIQS
jgi:hypothetical protein